METDCQQFGEPEAYSKEGTIIVVPRTATHAVLFSCKNADIGIRAMEAVKLPVDGVSEAQIYAAEAIVDEIDQQFASFGGRTVDQGWALRPNPWKADEPLKAKWERCN